MNKMFKAFAISLILVLVVLVPACRSSRKKVPVATTTTQATDTVPNVPTTTTQETRVDTQPADFVTEPTTTRETLPTDIEQLNRYAQERGYLRDAFFDYDEAALSSDAQDALTSSARWLRENPQYNLLIEGHCDERGTEQYNLALGDRRANTARDFLMTLGLEASRVRTVSYGEERAFDEGHDESAWSKNRRAHLVLVGRNR